jgi:hypothetical protein
MKPTHTNQGQLHSRQTAQHSQADDCQIEYRHESNRYGTLLSMVDREVGVVHLNKQPALGVNPPLGMHAQNCIVETRRVP